MSITHRIAPCLWFNDRAEEAVRFYLGIFPHSQIKSVSRYTEAGKEVHGRPAGSVLTIEFELDRTPFTALNGGPAFSFNEAMSLQVYCADQHEIDHYWVKLTEGGDPKAQQCGWLKDKFGVSWQVAPIALIEMMSDTDTAKTSRLMEALLPMKKLDLAALEAAYRGS